MGIRHYHGASGLLDAFLSMAASDWLFISRAPNPPGRTFPKSPASFSVATQRLFSCASKGGSGRISTIEREPRPVPANLGWACSEGSGPVQPLTCSGTAAEPPLGLSLFFTC